MMLVCHLPVSWFVRIQAELGACLQTQPLQRLWQEFCMFKASLNQTHLQQRLEMWGDSLFDKALA